MSAACAGPAERPAGSIGPEREAYGPQERAFGEWSLPGDGDALPVVVLVHGGYWGPRFGPDLEDELAAELVRRGYAVWNVDYRASDEPWPATFVDAAAALDHLRDGRYTDRLDLDRVAVVGHSAGGQLALWLASRSSLPADAPGAPGPDAVEVALAVGQAPVADLVAAADQGLGGSATQALLDGTPAEVPDRYAVASPLALLPPDRGTDVLLVHGDDDEVVPLSQSRAYAGAAGDRVELRVVPDVGHFEHLDPGSTALPPVYAALREL